MRIVPLIAVTLIGLASSACQHPASEKASDLGAEVGGSSEPFDVRVDRVEAQRQWVPPSGGSFAITEGMSLTLTDGTLDAVRADEGFEIVVVSLDVKRNAPDARLPLADAAAVDAEGKRYQSAVTPLDPIGAEERQSLELGFVVPSGTSLHTVELSKDVRVDVRSQ